MKRLMGGVDGVVVWEREHTYYYSRIQPKQVVYRSMVSLDWQEEAEKKGLSHSMRRRFLLSPCYAAAVAFFCTENLANTTGFPFFGIFSSSSAH